MMGLLRKLLTKTESPSFKEGDFVEVTLDGGHIVLTYVGHVEGDKLYLNWVNAKGAMMQVVRNKNDKSLKLR